MEFERMLELVGDEPVFETALLLAGKVNPNIVRLQLTRWTKSGLGILNFGTSNQNFCVATA